MSEDKPLFKTPAPGHTPPKESRAEIARKIKELEETIALREGLPFKYGWKWYKWARAFYESKNKINLLCAANQISKSSTQIRKCIEWATNKNLWPDLWNRPPVTFWYLYPTTKQVSAEWETKWNQFMPQGHFKDHPQYGWRLEKNRGEIIAIHFNSGVHVYFKTYSQNVMSLQTGTVDSMFADEELPLELYNELMMRLSASNGYFHMVFTATIGQEFWRKALEPEQGEHEELPHAFKQTVSLYDAMFYEDGTESQWSEQRIAQVRANCSTHQEVLKRVYGKFIVLEGRKYSSFDIKRHVKPKHQVPQNWLWYAGADPGSGGESGHPSALVYVAVRPDYRQARVVLSWRGDGIPTTAGDTVLKHIAIKKEHKIQTTQQFYDWSSKDFFEIASRNGEPFEKAEKSHDIGEDVINTLFKHDMLMIYEDSDNMKLASELSTLKKETNKKNAKDDLCDALRYAVTRIPWDWSVISGAGTDAESLKQVEQPMNDMERQVYERRKAFDEADKDEAQRVQDEFDEWNDQY